LHLKIPTEADDPSHAAYALKGREARHPHNIYLQTWLELGAIGAALLLGVGLAWLWAIGPWPPFLQGSAYALFAVGGAVGVSGFEFWQTWMLAVVTLPGARCCSPSVFQDWPLPGRSTRRDGTGRGKSSFTCHNSLID
jgi:hypothetical protein